MIELEAFVEKEFERALEDKLNMNADGRYNPDYVEADCYCAVKDEYGPDFDRPQFFEVIDKLLDNLQKKC